MEGIFEGANEAYKHSYDKYLCDVNFSSKFDSYQGIFGDYLMLNRQFKRLLLESGNVFKQLDSKGKAIKDADGKNVMTTQRIQLKDIDPTVSFLEDLTGLSLRDNMLGTTGKKESSGDLDLAVDESKISKEELIAKLKDAGFREKEDIAMSGTNVHLKTPIGGDKANGFVQTDFMFGDPKWFGFSMQGGGIDSPYRGTHKHILLASIAKGTKTEERPEGMKWSYLRGLLDRATDTEISKDPREIASILLGPGYSSSDLSNVETISSAIQDRPDFDVLVSDANETFAKDKSSPVPPVTRTGLIQEGLEVRIQHPEDMIYWEGSAGAQKAINALLGLAENAPTTTTVKWDGSPAIVFGIDINGKFILTDKGGFTVKSYKGRSESPEELEQMFLSRQNKPGKTLTPEYAGFAVGMKGVFEPFRRALQDVQPGTFFKGDLLYRNLPEIVKGDYQFKPNVVTYRVSADSELGKKIGQSTVGVVLHGIMREDASGVIQDESLDDLTQHFHGDLSSGGLLAGDLFIFSPVFVNKPPKFGLDMVKDAEKVQAKVESSAGAIDTVLDEEVLTAKKMKDLPDVLYSYTNSKADSFDSVSLNDFKEWVTNSQKLSKQKIGNVLQYISEQSSGFTTLFEVVKAIESLKNKLVGQFDEQDMAVKAFIGDAPGGEGYVTKGKDSLLKLVHRGGFTAANRAVIRESVVEGAKKIGFYDGSFKPFHRGHYESILAAKQKVDKLFVIASSLDRVREGEFPLSGQASQEYLEKYIKPVLQEQGIDLIISSMSPVRLVYDTAKADYDNDPNAEVFFFAGVEDIHKYSTKDLQRNFPNLSERDAVHAVPIEMVMGSTDDRISGTLMRKALDTADLAMFKSMLPDIPSVQRDAAKIMELFIKDSPHALRRELEKDKERKEKEKTRRQAAAVARRALREMLSLYIQGFLLEAKKKKKAGFHVPKKYEPMVQALKKKFGDPTEMESGPEKKKAGALVFGTVQNAIRNKKK